MKLALVVTDNFSAWNFRRGLLSYLVSKGVETSLVAPNGPHDDDFRRLGVRLLPIHVDRRMDPFGDARFTRNLTRIFRHERFDAVHNVSIKPNIFGSWAAARAGVPRIFASVTGIGNVYMHPPTPRARALRAVVSALYKSALARTTRVWFQNRDDVEFFVTRRLVSPEKIVLIRGSGVDTSSFGPGGQSAAERSALRSSLGLSDSDVVVTMVARTLWSKGIEELAGAARLVAASDPAVKFLLVGDGEEGNPDTIPEAQLRALTSPNFLWLGWRNDVRALWSASDVAILLARYREGLPRSMIEALAMGMPVIATDVPGCREVVDDGRNGFLVPPLAPSTVADRVRRLAASPQLRAEFSAQSRKMAVAEFDLGLVNRRIFLELYGSPDPYSR